MGIGGSKRKLPELSGSTASARSSDDNNNSEDSFRAPPPVQTPPFLPDKRGKNWSFWTLRCESLDQAFTKHLEKFGGEFYSRFGLGELIFERIKYDEDATFDTSIGCKLLKVIKLDELFSSGIGESKHRLVIECREIKTADKTVEDTEKQVIRLIAKDELASVLDIFVENDDFLFLFGDHNIESSTTINLNSRYQHPITVAHMRLNLVTRFNTSDFSFKELRRVAMKGRILFERQNFGQVGVETAMLVSPTHIEPNYLKSRNERPRSNGVKRSAGSKTMVLHNFHIAINENNLSSVQNDSVATPPAKKRKTIAKGANYMKEKRDSSETGRPSRTPPKVQKGLPDNQMDGEETSPSAAASSDDSDQCDRQPLLPTSMEMKKCYVVVQRLTKKELKPYKIKYVE